MPPIQQRQNLLSVLAKSPLEAILECWSKLRFNFDYDYLKQPEIGMVMVKAKAGGTGQAFNMGEMTTTRSVIQLQSGEVGYGYIAGRDKQKSEVIAVIDACFQLENLKEKILKNVLSPLEEELTQSHQQQQEKTDSTKVNFFTMVRANHEPTAITESLR